MSYVIFAGDNYYPLGGWDDFQGSYKELLEAVEAAAGLRLDWWQVVDGETGEVFRAGKRE